MRWKIRECFVVFTVICGAAASVKDYAVGNKVEIYVNKVGPYANIHETYHYFQLPLCRPDKIVHKSLSLGQVLEGDRMAESSFDISFGKEVNRVSLCNARKLSIEDTNMLVEAIEEDYYFEITFDDLKVRDFLGYVEEAKVFPHEHKIYVFTHLHFTATHNDKNVLSVVVKMEKPVEIFHHQSAEIDFKYSVNWIHSTAGLDARVREGAARFSSRTMHIHWLSVLNSVLLVCLLIVFVVIIVFSAVRRDLSKYNRLEDEDDMVIDNGWKTVGMDVFRRPPYAMLLSAILGVGCQFLVIGAVILTIGALNIMNVHRHGLLNTLSVVLYALTSGVAGYVSSARYRQMEGKNWIANINLTSLLFAAPMVLGWAVSNTVSWAYQSTQALPWTTVLVVLSIWLVFGYPLTVMGGLIGRSLSTKYSAPCRTRAIPRELPRLSWIHSMPVVSLIGGFLPFSAICVELYYIFSTMWGRESYTLFYMILIVFCLLIAVVACTSVALTYFQLNMEDYRWWWRSVFLGGSVGLFVFLYGIYFLHWRSEMSGAVQLTEFFTHLLLLCYIAFLSLGTVSHIASHTFVRLGLMVLTNNGTSLAPTGIPDLQFLSTFSYSLYTLLLAFIYSLTAV